MNAINKSSLALLRATYPSGSTVRCLNMDDPYAPIPIGMLGTVEFVDDMGTIHVHWSNGPSLGLIYGKDSFERVTNEKGGDN